MNTVTGIIARIEKYNDAYMIAVPILSAAIVQCVIWNYFFILDDYLFFYQAANMDLGKFLINPHGGHIMIVRNLFFYILFKLFGLNAPVYMALMFVNHLLNAALLYRVLDLFTGNRSQAVFWSSLWGSSPLHVASLGWFSGYGHVLVATFFLWILIDIGKIKLQKHELDSWTAFRWIVLMTVSSISWGIGMAIALVFPFLAWLLLYNIKKRTRIVLILFSLVLIIPLIYNSLIYLYKVVYNLQPGKAGVDYSNPEILIQSLKMFSGMVAFSLCSMLTGPFIFKLILINLNYMLPVSFICVAIICAAGSAVYFKASRDLQYKFLACLILLLTLCAAFSFGRAWYLNLFGLTIPLMVFIPRYYYIATMVAALLLGLICTNLAAGHRVKLRSAYCIQAVIIVAYIVMSIGVVKHPYWENGDSSRQEYNRIVSGIQREIDHTPKEKRTVYIKNERVRKIGLGSIPRSDFPGISAIFIIAYPENKVNGKNIYFVEEDTGVVEKVRKNGGSRISRLFLTREEAGDNPVITISF